MAVRSVQASLNELDQFAANFKQRPFVQHADLFEVQSMIVRRFHEAICHVLIPVELLGVHSFWN